MEDERDKGFLKGELVTICIDDELERLYAVDRKCVYGIVLQKYLFNNEIMYEVFWFPLGKNLYHHEKSLISLDEYEQNRF